MHTQPPLVILSLGSLCFDPSLKVKKVATPHFTGRNFGEVAQTCWTLPGSRYLCRQYTAMAHWETLLRLLTLLGDLAFAPNIHGSCNILHLPCSFQRLKMCYKICTHPKEVHFLGCIVYYRGIVLFKHQMPENTSNLATQHTAPEEPIADGASSTVLAGKHQTPLPPEKTKGRLKVRLGFKTVLGKVSCTPRGDVPARDWDGAQPLVLQRARAGSEICWWQAAALGRPGWAGQWHGAGTDGMMVWCTPEGDLAWEKFWFSFLFLVWMCSLRHDIALQMGHAGCRKRINCVQEKSVPPSNTCRHLTALVLPEACMGKVRLWNTAIPHRVFSTAMLLTWSIFQIQVSVTACRESNLGLCISTSSANISEVS